MGRKVFLVLAAALLALGGLSASTQYVAETLHHPSQFGPPLITISGARVYAPWAWLRWSARYEQQAPKVFGTANGITLAGALGSCLLGVVAAARRGKARTSVAHGSARWADTNELRKAGLLGEEGIVLCQTSDARFSSKSD